MLTRSIRLSIPSKPQVSVRSGRNGSLPRSLDDGGDDGDDAERLLETLLLLEPAAAATETLAAHQIEGALVAFDQCPFLSPAE